MSTKATKLPSGNWRVRVEIESEGKRRWKSFTAPTRKEAEYLAAQYAYTQKERNKPQDMTIGGAMDAFIDARTAVLSPSTIRSYRQIRRCYFQEIAGMKLRDITNSYIQRQINAISLTCSPKTVRNVFSLLTAVSSPAISTHTKAARNRGLSRFPRNFKVFRRFTFFHLFHIFSICASFFKKT